MLPASSKTDTDAVRYNFARWPVISAAVALLLTLAIYAGQYGYHRDELYFRMLRPAWGYVDQPPLSPFLARLSRQFVADEVWAARIPALILAVASVFVLAHIAREVGGGPLAQGLAAWGYAFGSMTLAMGHVFLTASVDLFVWPAVILALMRALLRASGRWWLVLGTVTGLSLYNKFLIVMLLVSLVIGLLVLGPRRIVWSTSVLGAAGLALLIGFPNLLYQALNGWPQLAMGAALSAHNGGSVRIIMWPFLLLMLGPPLVPFWVAGLTALIRRPPWRPIRSLVIAFPVLLILVCAAGGQFYYPYGLLAALFGIGCVPVADFARRGAARRATVLAAVVANSVVCTVISLPVVPMASLSSTPIPDINSAVADEVGWQAYTDQVRRVTQGIGLEDGLVIIPSNYGEAGALDRYGDGRLPPVFSGHNALYALGPPPESATTVVVVGAIVDSIRPYFASCSVATRLDNGVNVDNEEQGKPVAVCTGRHSSWSIIWPKLRHLD